jgi:hypothetical protein
VGVEYELRIGIEQTFAALQPLRGLGGKFATVKIQFSYLFEPALKLLQLDVVFFELVVSKVLRGRFLGDLGIEIIALVDEFAISIVPVGLEAGDDLVLLPMIERGRFQNDRLATHFGDVVRQHLQPPRVVIGFGQEAYAVLQIDDSHALQPPPQGDPLGCRLRRDFVRKQ